MESGRANLRRAVLWEMGMPNIEQGMMNVEGRFFAPLKMIKRGNKRNYGN